MISTCNEGLKLIKLKESLTLHKITFEANGLNAPNKKIMKMDIALSNSQILIGPSSYPQNVFYSFSLCPHPISCTYNRIGKIPTDFSTFLSDPGVPGVRSMGLGLCQSVSQSKTMCRLN